MEGKNPQISVIVPIYKVEPYLHWCLDSIVHQTYQNLEILLIDDGSPDGCGAICDEYAKKDARIRVTHKKNGGLSAAWNDGLRMAAGEWVAFVDSDDWLDLDFFEKMIFDQDKHADVVLSAGYYWEDGSDTIRWIYLKPFEYREKEKDLLKMNLLMRPKNPQTKGTLGYVWGKLFRRDFILSNGISFDPQIRAGLMVDSIFNWDVFEKSSLILGSLYCGYHYRITQTSGTFKFDPNRPKAQEYVEEEFFRRVKAEGASDAVYKAVESRCLRDIVHNLQHCYFHPDNPASRREVAKGIQEMKQMPYYHQAICSRNNPCNTMSLKAFQWMLRLPWIWPLRVMIALWERVDGKKAKA